MSAPSHWINFKELRANLKFADVFQHYKVALNTKGDRATGFCPLPTHEGKGRSPSFSANLSRGIWQCFGCRAKGNILDFACRMEGFDPDNPKELRKAALKIRDVFLVGGEPPPPNKSKPVPLGVQKNVLVNAPIDFELKTLDPDHPYLRERGFTAETISHFGLGFCNRGMLKGRIAIPLHDSQARLVGYAGRITRDDLISEKCPKYLFPGTRERGDTILEFRKSLLLYNAHHIVGPVDHLFVVEGFPATWWLWQTQYRNVIALMGADCSEAQATLIVDLVKPDGKVWVMSDGDAAGEHCAETVLRQVAPHRFVRWVRLSSGQQPTGCSTEELIGMFDV